MTTRSKAFTEVFNGNATDSFHLWSVWGHLPEDKIELRHEEDGGLSVWVANQMINWEHFDETEEFVPVHEKVKRSSRRSSRAAEVYNGITPTVSLYPRQMTSEELDEASELSL